MRKRAELPGRVGALSVKSFDSDTIFLGYDLLLLPGNRRLPLARLALTQSLDETVGEWFTFRRFRFNQAAFSAAGQVLLAPVEATEYLIDEVGPMELGGGGFAPMVEAFLKRGVDLVLSVRPHLLSDISAHFGFEPAEVIRL